MLGAEFLENSRAALRVVTDELHAGVSLDRADELVGKPLEGCEGFFENNSGNFPMPGGRVLAGRAFTHNAVARSHLGGTCFCTSHFFNELTQA